MSDVIGLIGGILGFVALGLLFAVFSMGIVYFLGTSDQPLPPRHRAFRSSMISAALLVAVPLVAVFVEGIYPEIVLVIAALLVMAAVLGMVFGFPASYWLAKRQDSNRSRSGASE